MTDIYQTVTDSIVRALEAGAKAGDFVMPWHRGHALHNPINAVTKKNYRGVNVLQLWCAAEMKGYKHGVWATYKQYSDLGGQVRKGETATSIVFWKPLAGKETVNDDGEKVVGKGGMVAKGYAVFNIDQVDNYTLPEAPAPLTEAARIDAAEAYFYGLGGRVVHGGDRAYYQPSGDTIRMPDFAAFKEPQGYYSTLAHEFTHWTGHVSRLDRKLSGRFGDEAYAAEELIAEIGAAFTCAHLGLSAAPRLDHASYIASWLRVLKGDKKAVFTASAKAQEAVDYCRALGQSAEAIAA